MSKRVIAIVGALVLAVIGTYVLVGYVRGAEDRALAGEEIVEVLVVDRLITAGTPVSELGSSVRTERVPAKVQAIGSVATLNGLQGNVATVDLLPGEQLVTTRFQPAAVYEQVQEAEREIEVPAGMLEVTVELNPARALGGAVRPGDTVGVLASFKPFGIEVIEPEDESEESEGVARVLFADESDPDALTDDFGQSTSTTTHLIIHKALVTRVHERVRSAASVNPTGEEPAADDTGREDAPNGNLFVTLALPVEDIEKIVFTAEHGSIWLARENAAAIEDGAKIQTRATVYR